MSRDASSGAHAEFPTPAQVYREVFHPDRTPAHLLKTLERADGFNHLFIGPDCACPGARKLSRSQALGDAHALCLCVPDLTSDTTTSGYLAAHGLGRLDGWLTTVVHALAAPTFTPERGPLDQGWLLNNARTLLDEIPAGLAAAPITLGQLTTACESVAAACLAHPEYDHDRLVEISWLVRTSTNRLPEHLEDAEWRSWDAVLAQFEQNNYSTTETSRQLWTELKETGTWVWAISRPQYPPGELYAISRHYHPTLGRLLVLPAFAAAQYPHRIQLVAFFRGEASALAGLDEATLGQIEAVRRLCRGDLSRFGELHDAYLAASTG